MSGKWEPHENVTTPVGNAGGDYWQTIRDYSQEVFAMDNSFPEEISTNLLDFICRNPSSALSARWVFHLPEDDQAECIAKMIDGAVYQETWLSYLEFTKQRGMTVTNEIVLEIIHGVGLDPYSAPLWLKLIDFVLEEDKKRELFQLALRVPLYEQKLVYKAYKAFEMEIAKHSEVTMSDSLSFADVALHTQILKSEPLWPDRFVDLHSSEETCRKVMANQWDSLLRSMLRVLEDSDEQHDLQLKRLDLAFRQLCTQFADTDVCWYAYASFMAYHMKDEVHAREIIEKGYSYISSGSTAFESLNAFLSKSSILSSRMLINKSTDKQLLQQKFLANCVNDSLLNRKQFRDIGKASAAERIDDWRVYHQWALVERYITGDYAMASKIYERGMSCVSKSVKNSILLSNEATKHHLLRREEREVLGYAERQVEILSSSEHEGLKRASWNHLVQTELLLGLPSLPKTLCRRSEHSTNFFHQSFIERYRLGNYIPCSSEDLRWLEFVDDLMRARKEEQEPMFESATRLKHCTLPSLCSETYACAHSPDVSLWFPLELPPNRENSSASQDTDEVVGSRTLRGRLVYKMRIDGKTEARLRREELAQKVRERARGGVAALGSGNNALQELVRKLENKKWNETQLRLCRKLSIDWIMGTLTAEELDLTKKRV